jgi:hypothetical protein
MIIFLHNLYTELTKNNEYASISELPSKGHELNHLIAGAISGPEDVRLIQRNVFLERGYDIVSQINHLSFILRIIQKTIFIVRKFDTDYKKAAPGGRSAPSMFS